MFDDDDEDDELEEQASNDEWIMECLEVLLNDYEPAECKSEADVLWSTVEITNAMGEHHGISSDFLDKVFNSLKKLGYKYTATGLKFEWMLKNKGYF